MTERRLTADEYLALPPDERHTQLIDGGRKKLTYERTGLDELWLVDTESNTVLVFRRSTPAATEFDVALEVGAGEQLATPRLRGLALDVASLFDR